MEEGFLPWFYSNGSQPFLIRGTLPLPYDNLAAPLVTIYYYTDVKFRNWLNP